MGNKSCQHYSHLWRFYAGYHSHGPIGGGGGNPTSEYPGGMPSLTSEGSFSNIPGASVVDRCLIPAISR